MAVLIEIFEDVGPVIGGRGTNTFQVYEGIMSAVQRGATYPNFATNPNPVERPLSAGAPSWSYERYFFMKITGDLSEGGYDKITTLDWYLILSESIGIDSEGLELYYKTTNTYVAPIGGSQGIGYTQYVVPSPDTVGILLPANNHATDPSLATTFTQFENSTTFYSDYLVVQHSADYQPSTVGTTVYNMGFEINPIAVETKI